MLLKGITVAALIFSLIFWKAGLFSGSFWMLVSFAVWFLAFLILWAISCTACTMFVDLNRPCRKHSRLYRFNANCIIDSLMQLFRVHVHVTGMEKLPDGKFLLVSNHRSAMDPMIEMGILRRYHIGFVAKQELFKIPVIGKLMHKCFCFSLDRGNPRDGLKMIREAADVIHKGVASVGIYPEGTRSRDGSLLPFKSGAFKIAQKAGCPIVVASISGSERILKGFPLRRKDVFLEIISVISAEDAAVNKTVVISDRVYQMIEYSLMSAGKESR